MKWSCPWNVLAVPAQLPALCRTTEGSCGDLAEMHLRHNPHFIDWIPSFAVWSFEIWRVNFLINIKDMRSCFRAHLMTGQGKCATGSRTSTVSSLIWLIQPNPYLRSQTPCFLLVAFSKPKGNTGLCHHHKQEPFNDLSKYIVLFRFRSMSLL